MEYSPITHEEQLLLLRYQILNMQLSMINQTEEHPFLEESVERDPVKDAIEQANTLQSELRIRGFDLSE